jgi:hypothetical protein
MPVERKAYRAVPAIVIPTILLPALYQPVCTIPENASEGAVAEPSATFICPVVVEFPFIVKPPSAAPLPIVEEAAARSPPLRNDIPLTDIAVEDAYGMVVAPVSEKKEEVARAVGTPEAPVTLARMEFAAIAESPAVPAE